MAQPVSTLTKSQLATLRLKLEEERARILRLLAAPDEAAPEEAGPEVEETAQRAAERDQATGVGERERALLDEVNRALAKLDAGTYGVSEETGEPIPYPRLLAVPWARQGADE